MFEEILKNIDLTKIILAIIALFGTGIFIGVQKNNKQIQKAGNNSQNYQSNGDLYIDQANKNITIINQYGITKENAKKELMQIFKDNMPKLREMAKEIWEKVHNFEDVENTQKANLQRRKIMF